MQYELVYPGSNAMIIAELKPGEKIQAEAGAMVAKSSPITIRGSMFGGIMRGFKRAFLGGESFFFQTMEAEGASGQVLIAPATPGDVKILQLKNGADYFIQGGCLLAAFDDVQMDTKMQKISRGFFSGAGLFVLHAKGTGAVAISAFGAVLEIAVPAGEKYVVDNGHLVAWSGDISYKMVKAGKTWTSSFTSGEGLACEFTGPGKVFLQSRNPKAFGGWVRKFVPSTGGGGLLSLFG